jgi:glycosyltransferase involved in cell wall biosynthesis
MNPPLVSVIIPTYRREAYIEETLASVFAQTFRDFEVIVVNDGSPDATADRLRPLVDSGRIQYYEQKNAGQAAARNTGLQYARGKFISFLDDDDLLPEDKLAWQVERLQSQPHVAVTYGFAQAFGSNHTFRHPEAMGDSGEIKKVLLRRGVIMTPGQALARTEDIRAIGGLDVSIRGAEDWDLWLRLADRGRFDYVERCALRYRVHPGNVSGNTRYMFEATMRVLHKHLGTTPLSALWLSWLFCRRFIGRVTAAPELVKARNARAAGKQSDAFRHLFQAVRYDPPLLISPRAWRIFFEIAGNSGGTRATNSSNH